MHQPRLHCVKKLWWISEPHNITCILSNTNILFLPVTQYQHHQWYIIVFAWCINIEPVSQLWRLLACRCVLMWFPRDKQETLLTGGNTMGCFCNITCSVKDWQHQGSSHKEATPLDFPYVNFGYVNNIYFFCIWNWNNDCRRWYVRFNWAHPS